MTVTARSTRRALWPVRVSPPTALLLVALINAGIFCRVCMNEFLFWDDHINVSMNPDLNPVSAASVGKYWTTPQQYLYIPLTYTVWTGLALIARTSTPDANGITLDPGPYHAVNLAAHVGAGMVVCLILIRLLPESVQATWAAVLGSLLFAIHPVQVESVAWVTGLKDVLSGLLCLLALWQYLIFTEAERTSHTRRVAYGLATVFFSLALISKPSAVALPLIAWGLEVLLLRRPALPAIRPLISWIVLSIAVLVITRASQPTDLQDFVTPLASRPIVALDAAAFYLYKLVLPSSLGIDYGRRPQWLLQNPARFWTWTIPILLAAIAWATRRRWPWIAASAGVFFAAILPVSGLVPFGFQNYSTVADHYLYLAMLGPALLLAAALSVWPRPGLFLGAGFLLLTFGCLSFVQIGYWHDTQALYTRAYTVNPYSWTANENLGRFALRSGDAARAERLFRASLQMRPRNHRVNGELGYALAAQGKLDEAAAEFQVAIRADPMDKLPRAGYADVVRRKKSRGLP